MPAAAYPDHLGYTIKRLYLVMGQYFNDVLRPYGVAHSQWYVLFYLHQAGRTTQRSLQDQLQVESATLTATLQSLEQKGWVSRHASSADRRVKELELSTAGKQLWASLPDPIAAIQQRMLQGIDEAEVRAAQKVLQKAIRNFEQPQT